jgi:hypothetical protein
VISGGKNSLRKAFVIFFKGEKSLYQYDMPNAHYTHASISHDKLIYVIGGRNSGRPITTVDAFDYQKGTWIRQEPLREERSYPAVTLVKG